MPSGRFLALLSSATFKVWLPPRGLVQVFASSNLKVGCLSQHSLSTLCDPIQDCEVIPKMAILRGNNPLLI